MKVPSEEATALSRMADAAAAAAAFTAEGLRDDLRMPSQQAQHAELAKRAQQASDAVLRGDADQGLVQEPDRRSYSRFGILTSIVFNVSLQPEHLPFGRVVYLASTQSQNKNNPLAGLPSFSEAVQDKDASHL